MTQGEATIFLLGPQRPEVNLALAVEMANLPPGPIAVISAGWQEAENDIDHVREAAGRSLECLSLYHRTDEVFGADARLADDYRERQDRLMELQRLYRLRLRPLARAARQMYGVDGDADMLAAEQRHAVSQLRALDRHHLHRTESLHRQFDERHNTSTTASLREHSDQIQAILQRCSAVIITGGNIAVLLNRMRMFGVDRMLGETPVIAWSAGAMVLAERVVLFHDRMPQGRRDAEILGAGLGIVQGYVILPDTARRLREKDRLRIGLMSRRFAPDTCAALDSGALLRIDGSLATHADKVRSLHHDGRFTRLRTT
jgi:hypothetical protein